MTFQELQMLVWFIAGFIGFVLIWNYLRGRKGLYCVGLACVLCVGSLARAQYSDGPWLSCDLAYDSTWLNPGGLLNDFTGIYLPADCTVGTPSMVSGNYANRSTNFSIYLTHFAPAGGVVSATIPSTQPSDAAEYWYGFMDLFPGAVGTSTPKRLEAITWSDRGSPKMFLRWNSSLYADWKEARLGGSFKLSSTGSSLVAIRWADGSLMDEVSASFLTAPPGGTNFTSLGFALESVPYVVATTRPTSSSPLAPSAPSGTDNHWIGDQDGFLFKGSSYVGDDLMTHTTNGLVQQLGATTLPSAGDADGVLDSRLSWSSGVASDNPSADLVAFCRSFDAGDVSHGAFATLETGGAFAGRSAARGMWNTVISDATTGVIPAVVSSVNNLTVNYFPSLFTFIRVFLTALVVYSCVISCFGMVLDGLGVDSSWLARLRFGGENTLQSVHVVNFDDGDSRIDEDAEDSDFGEGPDKHEIRHLHDIGEWEGDVH